MTGTFETYIALWGLIPDGPPIVTHSSRLLPVRRNGLPAMLKIAEAAEERLGGLLMVWWDGQGAARVLAHDGDALLLERAEGRRALADYAKDGDDDTASRVICGVVARLHARANPLLLDSLVPLARWFRELGSTAVQHGGVLTLAADTARHLLSTQRDVVTLHGDIHHRNILDFGAHGWLAIDPKGLTGERGFDYANLFCNPDRKTAMASGRLSRQASVVAEASGVPRTRLLQWVLAYAGLSAAWTINTGEVPEIALDVAELAAAELAKA
jgi:streptomycin 6-kinase